MSPLSIATAVWPGDIRSASYGGRPGEAIILPS